MRPLTRTLLTLLVALAASAGVQVPVAAQDTETEDGETEEVEEFEFDEEGEEFFDPLTVEEIATAVDLTPECDSAPDLVPSVGVDCAFRLLQETTDNGSPIVFADLIDQTERPPEDITRFNQIICDILPNGTPDFFDGDPSIVCREIGVFLAETEITFNLVVNSVDTGATVVLERSLPTIDSSIFGFSTNLVTEGSPLILDIFNDPSEGNENVHLIVGTRRTGEEITRVTLEPTDGIDNGFFASSVEFDLPDGLYRWWPCFGPDLESCERSPGGRAFQVMDLTVQPLFADYNTNDSGRINVVFMGSGLNNGNWPPGADIEVASLARRILTVQGKPLPDEDGGQVWRLGWGPFSIEPLRSNLHKFNFWYVEGDLFDESSVIDDPDSDSYHAGFDTDALPNLHVAVLYYSSNESTSDARLPSFAARFDEPVAVPDSAEQIRFGDTRVWINPFNIFEAPATLAHEWGHALFGLQDEYTNLAFGSNTQGPNCAPDLAAVEAQWGDLFGEVDPFTAEVEQAYREVGLEATDSIAFQFDSLADAVRIGPTPGGCYAEDGNNVTYRASPDSLMNSNMPIFGSVNRAQVEKVLALFDAPAADPPAPTTTTTTPPPPTTDQVTTTTGSTSTSATTEAEETAAPESGNDPSTGAGLLFPVLLGVGLLAAMGAVIHSRR